MITEETKTEVAAFTLRAYVAYAHQSDDICPVSWAALRSAKVGDTWHAVGGGSCFDCREKATVVYQGERATVVLFESFYKDDNTEGDGWKTPRLQAFEGKKP